MKDYYNLEKEFPKILDEYIELKKENKRLREELERVYSIVGRCEDK